MTTSSWFRGNRESTSARRPAPPSPMPLLASDRESRERFSLRAEAICPAPSSPRWLQLRSRTRRVLLEGRAVVRGRREAGDREQHLRKSRSRLQGRKTLVSPIWSQTRSTHLQVEFGESKLATGSKEVRWLPSRDRHLVTEEGVIWEKREKRMQLT